MMNWLDSLTIEERQAVKSAAPGSLVFKLARLLDEANALPKQPSQQQAEHIHIDVAAHKLATQPSLAQHGPIIRIEE